jgi:hypothetical protein
MKRNTFRVYEVYQAKGTAEWVPLSDLMEFVDQTMLPAACPDWILPRAALIDFAHGRVLRNILEHVEYICLLLLSFQELLQQLSRN